MTARTHPQYHAGKCQAPMAEWTVEVFKANYSAFNGYQFQSSAYSQLRCDRCQAIWRTKAKYVSTIKHKASRT